MGATALTVLMWFTDPVTNQRAFGSLIGAELLIFATMIQIYRKPSISGANNTWPLLGCATAALFLLLAVQLSTP